MEFPYVKCESKRGFVYRPCLPVTLGYRGKEFPIGRALVDTGSDITLLPLEIAHYLEVELDDTERIVVEAAGGGSFRAMPSQKKIDYMLKREGFRPIRWQGVAYFAEDEEVILLGHHQCLEKFDLTFQGPERKIGVLPRW